MACSPTHLPLYLSPLSQVLQRSREAILALELLTMLSEGVDVTNMMEGSFDFKQFQVHNYSSNTVPVA